jgi:hypothetical protein
MNRNSRQARRATAYGLGMDDERVVREWLPGAPRCGMCRVCSFNHDADRLD